MPLEIVTVPCLRDNYAYLLRDGATGAVGLVDAPEEGPIAAALAERGWSLDLILITHHHDDHIAAVDALREAHGAFVIGAEADRARLPRLDRAVAPGDTVSLGSAEASVIDVSGHTMGHVAYYFAADGALFTADSLMALGCGRLFEGTAPTMWESLSRLAALPDATMVYSGHEYTASNARFALSVDPDNPALRARAAEVAELRERDAPTVPAALGLERATNPFLRAADPAIRARLGLLAAPDAEVFAELRRRKDVF
ncbi:MAG: hydroxyacylglutathione hydrolase [Solirubrobacteraceae bacterium]|jgi:hydroxyacylglutathione hydrolase|nr:hydroxyacylglutathione hydrolase [Solirubrobacteraceae bacterium]